MFTKREREIIKAIISSIDKKISVKIIVKKDNLYVK